MRLLAVLLWVQIVLFIAAVILLFGHGLWLRVIEGWTRPWLEQGRVALRRTIYGSGISEPDRQLLLRLPRSLQFRLVSELARSLTGTPRARLEQLAAEMGMVRRAERQTRSLFWWERLRGARVLTLLRKGDSVMPHLLRDRHPTVRTQAVEWASTHPTPETTRELFELMLDPSRLCRFTVRDTLLSIGAAGTDQLLEFLSIQKGPPAAAALEVATGRVDPRFLEPALRLSADDFGETRARAANLLAALGGERAIDRLVALLEDDDPEVRAAAAQGIGKLRHWPAAPLLAPRLRDRAWLVRREAGFALRAIGGPGLIYLRRFLNDNDRYAADMARQILDLPLNVDPRQA